MQTNTNATQQADDPTDPTNTSLGISEKMEVESSENTKSVSIAENDSSISQKILIIGNGIAGLSATKAARKQDPHAEIVILSQESHPAYYRLRLCELIGKDTPLEGFYIHPIEWYSQNGISLFLSCDVLSIHNPAKVSNFQEHHIQNEHGNVITTDITDETSLQIKFSNSSSQTDKISIANNNLKYVSTNKGDFAFDKLVIASGSTPVMPPFPNRELAGIFTLWNLENITAINEALKNSHSAVIVGGGLLGLEIAFHISQMGISTTLIEGLPRILPKQLDESGSGIFTKKIESLGIRVITGQSVKEFQGVERVEKVVLADGQILNADIVIISVGVRPNINIFGDCGILLDRYIQVNEYMQVKVAVNYNSTQSGLSAVSSNPGDLVFSDCIYAAGDVASYNKTWFGLWTVANSQGQIAGTNAAGGHVQYHIDNYPYILNTMETKIAVSGDVIISEGEIADVLQNVDPIKYSYIKLVFKEGVLIGGILIGEPSSKFVKLQTLIKNKATKDNVTLIDFLPV